jgi:superfamily II DNA or RNA helicase
MIAHLILSRPAPPARVGAISLRPHQTEAITRIKLAFEEFRGAFLCDAVGTGKTYIGLAVAREMSNPIIIAPAALREMWLAAITAGQRDARFVSVEALSYGVPSADDCGGLVVDEAHHFRNANTLRYRALSKLAHNRNVLLMTAPVISLRTR